MSRHKCLHSQGSHQLAQLSSSSSSCSSPKQQMLFMQSQAWQAF